MESETAGDRFYGITVGENGYVLTAPLDRVLVFTRVSMLASWLEENAVRVGEAALLTPVGAVAPAPPPPKAPAPSSLEFPEPKPAPATFAPDTPQGRAQPDTLEIATAGFIEDLSFVAPELRPDRLSDRLVDLCEDFQLDPARLKDEGSKFVEWLLTLEGDLSTQGDEVHKRLRALFAVDPALDGS